MNEKLTHFDEGGRAWMVDVGAKDETARRAVAAGVIRMRPETLALIQAGDPAWERFVPAEVVGVIKEKRLFGLPT